MRLFQLLPFLILLPALLAAQKPAYSYHRLQGRIGDQPVVLHLHRHGPGTWGDQNATTYTGVYYYTRYEAPVQFFGEARADGQLALTENIGAHTTGKLMLRPLTNGSTSGTWSDSAGVKKLPVELRETYPKGTVRLDGGYMQDSLLLFPKIPNSPQSSVSYTWLEPAAGTEAGLKKFLLNELILHTLHDTVLVKRCCRTPRQAFDQLRRQAFEGYRDSLGKELSPDSTDYFYMYNYSQDVSVEVYTNDNSRLSLGIMEYLYTGGAHGNYATSYYTYDVLRRRLLRLSDVFKPGYEAAVEKALTRAARQRAGLKAGEPLDSYYFVDDIPVTENFYLTGKGIVFGYPPYEVASYADGQVELFISFAEVQQWMKLR